MKKLFLLLLIPTIFLNAESRLNKKKITKILQKKTKVSIPVNGKHSNEKVFQSIEGLKEETILLSGNSDSLLAKILFDKENKPAEIHFLKKKKEKYYPASNNEGISKILFKITDKEYTAKIFDSKGKLSSENLFQIVPEGWEIRKPKGIDIQKEIFDTRGLLLQSETYNANYKLKSRHIYKYNENCLKMGNANCKSTIELYGADSKLAQKEVYEYDENCLKKSQLALEFTGSGCKKLEEIYGPNGKLKGDEKNIARKVYNYDGRGNFINIALFNSKGKLLGREQPVVYKFNEKGNLLRKEFYGEDGKPEADRNGIAIVDYEYDQNCLNSGKAAFDSKCRTLEKNLGLDGEPVEGGFLIANPHRMVYKYDDKGNRVLQEAYGIDGKLMQAIDGNITARAVFKYDDKGNLTEEEHYGANGKLVNVGDFSARKVLNYDYNCIQAGNQAYECVILKEFYGYDGKLKFDFFSYGIARTVYKFNESCIRAGNNAEDCYSQIEYFGTDEMPIDGLARIQYTHDERGNQTQKENFGKDGKIIDDDKGVSRMTTKYDSNGNKFSSRYFNSSGSIVKMEFFPTFPNPSISDTKIQLNLNDSFQLENVKLLKVKKN